MPTLFNVRLFLILFLQHTKVDQSKPVSSKLEAKTVKNTSVKKDISSSKKPAAINPILITPVKINPENSSPKSNLAVENANLMKPLILKHDDGKTKNDNAREVLGPEQNYVHVTVEKDLKENDVGGLLKAMLPKPRVAPGQAENHAGEVQVDAPPGDDHNKINHGNHQLAADDNDLDFIDNKQAGNDDFDIVDKRIHEENKNDEQKIKTLQTLDDDEKSNH